MQPSPVGLFGTFAFAPTRNCCAGQRLPEPFEGILPIRPALPNSAAGDPWGPSCLGVLLHESPCVCGGEAEQHMVGADAPQHLSGAVL